MRSVNVAYFLAAASGGAEQGGRATYAWRILHLLLETLPHVQLCLIISRSQLAEVEALREQYPDRQISYRTIVSIDALSGLNRNLVGSTVSEPNKRYFLHVSKWINHLEWQLFGCQVDIIHSPVQGLPTLGWRRPYIVTMHDVQELHMPEFFSPNERLFRAKNYWWALETASKVVVSYEHVKEDLLKYFQLPAAKIHVCPHPISETWLPSRQPSLDILAEYELPSQFMLYPAQTWPHKNHAGLLRGMAYLRDELNIEPLPLVCTGKANEYADDVHEEAKRLGLSSSIIFLGMVSDEALLALYKACKFLVLPTLYEAGSFPLIEGMMAGAPAICARTTSLPDTIGDTRFTFDGDNVEELAKLLKKMMLDPAFLQANIANSRIQTERLTRMKDVSADAFLRLYSEINSERP